MNYRRQNFDLCSFTILISSMSMNLYFFYNKIPKCIVRKVHFVNVNPLEVAVVKFVGKCKFYNFVQQYGTQF